MKQDMILLFGKSGSGKNFCVNTFNLKPVISHTTRPIRKNEINGIDKHFEKRIHGNTKKIVAYNERGQYKYWATENDLKGKDVYVIDLPGIEMLLAREDLKEQYNFKIVYIDCSVFRRIKNMLNRGDSIKNIISRLYIDWKQFKNWKKVKPIIIKI